MKRSVVLRKIKTNIKKAFLVFQPRVLLILQDNRLIKNKSELQVTSYGR